MAKAILSAALLALLAGCVSTGNLCTVGPFRPDAGFETRLTPSEKEQARTWNDSGADICGWKP